MAASVADGLSQEQKFDLRPAIEASSRQERRFTLSFLTIAGGLTVAGGALAYSLITDPAFGGNVRPSFVIIDGALFVTVALLLLFIRPASGPLIIEIVVGMDGVSLVDHRGMARTLLWNGEGTKAYLSDGRQAPAVNQAQPFAFRVGRLPSMRIPTEAYVAILTAAKQKGAILAETHQKLFGGFVVRTTLRLAESSPH
jgi:hypothetical protein